jgi:hypothetical protein
MQILRHLSLKSEQSYMHDQQARHWHIILKRHTVVCSIYWYILVLGRSCTKLKKAKLNCNVYCIIITVELLVIVCCSSLLSSSPLPWYLYPPRFKIVQNIMDVHSQHNCIEVHTKYIQFRHTPSVCWEVENNSPMCLWVL